MKDKIIINLLITIIILESVFAAPLPRAIAIKSDTKECAGYWGGDEYVSYKLPSGWEAYYPNNDDTITTEFGSCEFIKDVGDPSGAEEEKCCNELGLTFVSEDIGESHGIWQLFYPPTIFYTMCLVIPILISLFLVIRSILKKPRKS